MKKHMIILLVLLAASAASQLGAQSRKSGDYFTVYSGELTTLNYLISGSENEHFMFANMIDNLVEYDRFGVLQPGLAESWTPSADGLSWTFKLRKGVQWYTWEKKAYAEVVAQDWVDAARYIMTKANASQTADALYGVIKNGEEFFEGKMTDFAQVGIKAIDKYTLQYTLNRPVPYFLSMLTYVTFLPVNGKFLEEQGTKFGRDHKSVLANGAYIMTEFEPQVSRVLAKNAKYWDARNVFIPRLIYRYNKEAATLSPELFNRGEISMSAVPTAILDTWMKDPAKKAILRPTRFTSYSYFYGFNFNPKFARSTNPTTGRPR